jgi:hypothetical protein
MTIKKIGESTRILTEKDVEAYHFHLGVLTDMLKAPEEDTSEKYLLDACLEYLVVTKLNNRDILNLLSLNDKRSFANNKDENITVGINAVLNVYHFMNVFKTAIYEGRIYEDR